MYYARFKDNIWAADLAKMESLSSKNENEGVKTLKDKKGKRFLNVFIETGSESDRNTNKLWVDQGREFYNEVMQAWLDNNDILMYSTDNEGKSVIPESFIKTLKAKIYKKMAANDSKSYFPYLNKTVDQYNNTFHHSNN